MTANTPCLSEHFLSGLRQVLGDARSSLPLHEPEFSGNEWVYVKECIDTGWVSSVGKYVDEFERKLAEFTGVRHAVAVVNGTAALHIALQIAGVKAGDEVLVPALSFVATANAVSHCGAVPHFVDSSKSTLGLDAGALASHLDFVAERTVDGLRNKNTGRRIAAIVPMHTFGHPVDMVNLMDVAARYSLPLVEDAAESLGSTYHGSHAGTFGCMGVLSFNGNKIITTGGGGAILTNDPEIAHQAKHLTTTAKQPHRWEFFHDALAYNYRLPNLNAALGCAQMERLPDFLSRKRHLAENYRKTFANIPGIHFVDEPEGCHSNFWLNAVRLSEPSMTGRDALLALANDAGYQCRPAWTLLNKLPMYQDCPHAELFVAEALEASLINLPSSPKLAELPT
jgi:perosamine synthetase